MKSRLIVLFIFCAIVKSYSWGPTGHRAIGFVANQYLTAKVKKRISYILKGQSIAMASTWMDEIRSDSVYDYTHDWHWTTIPDGETYEDMKTNPDGKIVEMIERITKELKTHSLSIKQEAEYVKMLIHLVGDIHQPLHVGKVGDKGGNEVKVRWFSDASNLHRVWDSDMIDNSKLSYTELGSELSKPDRLTINKWQSDDVQVWAMESVSYRQQVYDIGDGKLGYNYIYKNFHLLNQRLLQAAVRLAGLLNQIYN